MDYNTVRTQMLMPEYGRNVQSMAEYLLTIEDPERRLKNAEAIIDIMAILNPHLKQIEDYRHKLWDHLYQMTDFKLEVNSPYPPPTAEEIRKKPQVLPYPATKIKHRHLGGNLEQLLEKGLAETDEEKKQGFTQHIGYYMKLAYANWHKEPVHDDMIKAELANISGGELQFDAGGGFRVQVDMRPAPTNYGKKQKYKGGGGGGSRNFQGPNTSATGSGNSYNKNRKYKNKNKGGGMM
jgi:hypothetical protein